MIVSKPACISWAIVLVAIAAGVGLNRHGVYSRVYGSVAGSVDSPGVERHVFDTPSGVIRYWRSRGYRGRKLVYVGREWGRVNPSDVDPELPLYRSYPLNFFNLVQEREGRLDDVNFLYVAAVTGLAREVTAALAEPGYTVIREQLAGSKNLNISSSGFRQTANGFPRYFTIPERLEAPGEPVLLLVSASYFRGRSAGDLLANLKRSGLGVDSVGLTLARHDPLVREEEREELREFARISGAVPHDARRTTEASPGDSHE